MTIGFNLPAGGGSWTQEAADNLLGQETMLNGQLVKVIECHVGEDGSLKGTVKYVEGPETTDA